ncbi:MAG: dihydrodipicolinate synthase family protein [Sporomusaceae bacterium]|nr:dihydrodipicolinate synthase family protein [Sporomusaceae bacterium]
MFKMQGIVPPMITPFDIDGNVDFDALESLVDFLAPRVDGLFITGSYGSGALMTTDERKLVAETTINKAGGRVPVIVMVGTTNNRQSVDLARHAEWVGATAVAAVGPYYFKHNDDSVCYFFEDIVKAVDIPVYVYNNPGFQGYPMDIKLLRRLKAIGTSGIKDATFDIQLHAAYQRLLKDDNYDVALGTEAMWLAARALGCEAFIPGLGNAFPEICRRMHREGMAGDWDECRQTQFEVNRLREIMYLAKSTQLAVYAMLEIRGIIRAYPRAPFIAASDAEKHAIREELAKMNMLMEA